MTTINDEPTYRPNTNGNFPGEILNPTNEQMDAYLNGSDEVTCCSGCNRFFDSIDARDGHHEWCEWEARTASENSYLAQDAERWLNG